MPLHTDSIITRMKARGKLLGVGFAVIFAVLIGRAVDLQVLDNVSLSKKADARFGRTVTLTGKRGSISDRTGHPLAISIPAYAIGLYTRKTSLLPDISDASTRIANILKMDRREVEERMRRKGWNWLKRPVTVAQGNAIRTLKIPGVEVYPFHERVYPGKELAGQLLGASDIDDLKGRSGLEVSYNTVLTPSTTQQKLKWDGSGTIVEIDAPSMESISGDNLTLTIDGQIQAIAETALEKAALKHKAISGMAVVMRPNTGEVLAMANYPGFNPNQFNAFSAETRKNRGVTTQFEPGSTMKVFLAAAAIESGKVNRSSIFYCENGSYKIGRHTINDTHKYEWLSLLQVIKFSSNIGVVKIAEIIGPETLQRALDGFGFGAKTGVNLPGEQEGLVRDCTTLYPVEFGSVAFGQGISATALQLATAYSAIANGGRLVQPWVVKTISSPSGDIKKEFSSPGKRRVIGAATARFMKKIMASVTAEGGTGVDAALDGYTVCGKTGTAQKIGPNGRYFKDRYIASFAGFVPMNKPELAIVVIVDDPRTGGYYGATVAGPAFREIAYKTLEYLHVEPESETLSEKLLLALKSEDKS